MVMKKIRGTTWYPQIHDTKIQWQMEIRRTGDNLHSTNIPLITYDEAFIPPNIKTNPQNASFAEVGHSHCAPESEISNFNSTLKIIKQDGTNKLKTMVVGVQVVSLAFLEDLTPKDEISTLDIQDILELLYETTDRQTYGLYNNTKVTETFSGSATLDAVEMGLTTTQVLEFDDFVIEEFYDAIHYTTIAGKIKSVQSGIKWYNLTEERPFVKIRIHNKSSTKKMNEYAYLGLRVILPEIASVYQPQMISLITADTSSISCDSRTRYLEYNENFNFSRV